MKPGYLLYKPALKLRRSFMQYPTCTVPHMQHDKLALFTTVIPPLLLDISQSSSSLSSAAAAAAAAFPPVQHIFVRQHVLGDACLTKPCKDRLVLTDMQALHLLADTAKHNQYATAEHGQQRHNSLQYKPSIG